MPAASRRYGRRALGTALAIAVFAVLYPPVYAHYGPANAALCENAHDVVFTYNLECELTHVNRATERLLGYSRAELVGMDPAVVIPGEQWEHIQRMFTDCLAGVAQAGPYETQWLTRDGRTVILEINPILLRNAGVPVGVPGIGRDV